ncbi:helix-turn-helix domain-containing protein [Thermoactinospora rubra]|uniref:helix-turn-helix domain-containing protein n=1 Tax=Thermoactinospora rubra TaxID=1088767 RepID=UPI000A1021AE|nr:helix-turn-helix domain-containing protein [Thermoactinospora rubra]
MARALLLPRPGKLRAAITAAGHNGKTLAEQVGVSKQFISLLMRGQRTCRPAVADAIASELGVPAKALFISPAVSEDSDNDDPEDDPMASPAVELDDPYLYFNEVAKLLNIPVKTLRDLRAKGKGPDFFPRGQRLMIRRSKALEWFRETYENATE